MTISITLKSYSVNQGKESRKKREVIFATALLCQMNLAYIILFILIRRVIPENTWQVFCFIDEETDVLKGRVICSKL